MRYFLRLLLAGIGILVGGELILHLTPLKDIHAPSFGAPQGYYSFSEEKGMTDIVSNVGTSTHYTTELSYDVWSNTQGCFDTPFTKDTTPYIYLTGDSSAWGYTPFEDKWGTIMEKLLGVRVAKCGLASVGTAQELIKAEHTIPLLGKPSLIVVAHDGRTDPGDDVWFKQVQSTGNTETKMPSRWLCSEELAEGESFLIKMKCWFDKNSLIYNSFKTAFKFADVSWEIKQKINDAFFIPLPNVEPTTDLDWAIHEKSILGFKKIAQEQGSDILFILIPSAWDVRSSSTPSLSNVHVKEFLDKNDIRYLDLFPDFKAFTERTGSFLYWQKLAPLNREGNHFVGGLVSKYIFENGVFPLDPDTQSQVETYLQSVNK